MRSKKGDIFTILVSGASGVVGYGILRNLQERGDCFLIGTTIYPDSPANCFSDVVEVVPRTDDPEYIDHLKTLIAKYSVDMIIPGIEADMSTWNKHRKELHATGALLLLNNPELISLCLDKFIKSWKKIITRGGSIRLLIKNLSSLMRHSYLSLDVASEREAW